MSEVYWLENVGALTRVASRTTPSWRATLPSGATDMRVDDGDVPADAVKFRDNTIQVFAPFSPGLRQIQLSYDMPVSRFPLPVTLPESTSVVEVLVEDPVGRARGAGLVMQRPVSVEQHGFQRFLAQNVPAGAAIEIIVGNGASNVRSLYVAIIVGIVGFALLVGLARTVMSPGGVRLQRREAPRAEVLAHAIAALDARFEKRRAPSDDERASYQTQRETLKAELTAVLAERDDQL